MEGCLCCMDYGMKYAAGNFAEVKGEFEMKMIAVMPIKLNNERLPGKNTKLLGRRPLMLHMLDSLKRTGLMDMIYVYCSQDSIKEYLPDGAVFLKRPAFLDLPSSNFTQIFEHFCASIDADLYVYAHATAPFVKEDTIEECICAVRDGGYDSAFCASKIQDYLWKDGKALNFDAADLPRSQDLEPIYRETSGIYVFKKGVFKKYHRRIGEHPYIKEVSYKEAVDINRPEDFRLAEALLDVEC